MHNSLPLKIPKDCKKVLDMLESFGKIAESFRYNENFFKRESLYVQVAMTVADKDTAEREYGNLAMIPDNYEKIVVTYKDNFPNTYKGIKTMTLREFLNDKGTQLSPALRVSEKQRARALRPSAYSA